MADTTNMGLGTLENHLKTVFERFARNRATSLEPKWQRNRANFYRDPTLDQKTWTEAERDGRTSKTVFDITKNKCMAAVTIIYDMVTQGGRLALMFMPEDLDEAKRETRGQRSEGSGQQVMNGEELVSQAAAAVQEALDKQTALVDRQFESCDARGQVLRCLLSGSIYGHFWAKRYVSEIATRGFRKLAPDVFEPFEKKDPAPAFEAKSIWNMFWDLESATPEQREGVIERTLVSPFDVRAKLDKPFYLNRRLKLVLDKMQSVTRATGATSSGPGTTLPPAVQAISERTRTGEDLEFWGRVPLAAALEFERGLLDEEVAALELDTPSGDIPEAAKEPGNEVYILAETIDGTLVRYARINRDEQPYFDEVWELNLDGPSGISVADNVEQEQVVLNGAVRSLEEATKVLGQLILAGRRENLKTDFVKLKTGLFLDLDPDCRTVKDAIEQLKLDDVTGPLYKIIELFMQMGDLASMIPRIEQGQQSFEIQTLGELKERLDKAGKYLGMVIQHYDRLSEWAGMNFYRSNMLNPEFAAAMGSFKVKALGFTSFMNKTVRLKGLIDVMILAKSDPDLKLMTRLKGLYAEIIKGYDVDPEQILKTAQEMEDEAAQNQALLATMQGDRTENNRVEMELQAKTQRLLAEARKADAQAQAIAEGMTLKRAQVVTELTAQANGQPPATPAPSPTPSAEPAAAAA